MARNGASQTPGRDALVDKSVLAVDNRLRLWTMRRTIVRGWGKGRCSFNPGAGLCVDWHRSSGWSYPQLRRGGERLSTWCTYTKTAWTRGVSGLSPASTAPTTNTGFVSLILLLNGRTGGAAGKPGGETAGWMRRTFEREALALPTPGESGAAPEVPQCSVPDINAAPPALAMLAIGSVSAVARDER